MTSIAILGAGPIGMITAWAAERNGHEPIIFAASREPSPVNIDSFLQQPIPGIHDESANPDTVVSYRSVGEADGYALKCYGRENAPVSWNQVVWGKQPAWWLSDVYLDLYRRYSDQIFLENIDGLKASDISNYYPMTMSTLSARVTCWDLNHSFTHVRTQIIRGQVPADSPHANEIVYSGNEKDDWYRRTKLRGWYTKEFAGDAMATHGDGEALLDGIKVISTTCDCNPGVRRVGRWAQYTRGILNHHAFVQATAFLATEGLGRTV